MVRNRQIAPVAQPQEPLRLVLRAALEERGLSVRRASKELHAFDARQAESSWKRTLNKALDEDDDYVFAEDTAAVVAAFFGKPDGYFVRPQQRATVQEENRRLREENAELRRRLGLNAGESAGGRA